MDIDILGIDLALEHYRQSVKDQRDQDQQRHEQQVQQVQAELRHGEQLRVYLDKIAAGLATAAAPEG